MLFATHADFYDGKTFQPYGYMIMEGNVLQTYGIVRKQPYFGVLKDGSCVIREFGTPHGDVAEAVSGNWMVMDGSYSCIRTGGYAAIGKCYVSNTNGLMEEGFYTFGEDRKML